jgi:hypothetical protein
MTRTPPSRPFDDSYLLDYSAEHLRYEFDMFTWLGRVCGNPAVQIRGPSAEDASRLNNVLIEGFAVHIRNVLDFLYLDRPQATDVVAADFFSPGSWVQIRPAISATLEGARVRANKEIAHLTTSRIAGSPPEKGWEFVALSDELRRVLRLFAARAMATRCSRVVAGAIH